MTALPFSLKNLLFHSFDSTFFSFRSFIIAANGLGYGQWRIVWDFPFVRTEKSERESDARTRTSSAIAYEPLL